MKPLAQQIAGSETLNPRPAVFLDRDGTLIEDRGFLSDPSQVALFPATVPALRRLHGLYVLTGHGVKHRHELSLSCAIVPGMTAAVDQILRRWERDKP